MTKSECSPKETEKTLLCFIAGLMYLSVNTSKLAPNLLREDISGEIAFHYSVDSQYKQNAPKGIHRTQNQYK